MEGSRMAVAGSYFILSWLGMGRYWPEEEHRVPRLAEKRLGSIRKHIAALMKAILIIADFFNYKYG